jgi:hypothetical protein
MNAFWTLLVSCKAVAQGIAFPAGNRRSYPNLPTACTSRICMFSGCQGLVDVYQRSLESASEVEAQSRLSHAV